MTQVTFYQLTDDDIQSVATPMVVDTYRARKALFIVCDDKSQAELWDEHLWQQPTDAFIPHNLQGEGPPNGAPVMLGWEISSVTTPVVLNISRSTVPLSPRVQQVIEFVPVDEEGKQAARARYKHYQQLGCQLEFKPISKETQNG